MKVNYLEPRQFVCDVALCECDQYRQINVGTNSYYVIAAFSFGSYCG